MKTEKINRIGRDAFSSGRWVITLHNYPGKPDVGVRVTICFGEGVVQWGRGDMVRGEDDAGMRCALCLALAEFDPNRGDTIVYTSVSGAEFGVVLDR